MRDEPDAYQAYLLRLWRTRSQGRWEWRASIDSPHTGERQLFPSLEHLVAFLRERCESQDPGLRQARREEEVIRRHRDAGRE